MDDMRFEYTYSAKEQEEIKKIREKYTEKPVAQPDKLEQLRRLDEGVTKKASTIALVIGIIGAVVMGAGMSLIMTDIAGFLGAVFVTVLGVTVGVVGMAGVVAAYPVYSHILKKERKKIAPEIMRLTDELMK